MPTPSYPFKTIAITGASRGIGAAFARELAPQAQYLLLIARREEDLRALQQELQAHCNVDILVADLSSETGQQIVAEKVRSLPELDLLINNAGFGRPTSFQATDYATHQAMIRLHADATARLSYAALPGMVARGHGAIINVASIIALLPFGSAASYTATKAYQLNFSLALGEELRGTGVRVQALCPGLTHTDFHRSGGFDEAANLPAFLWATPEYVVQTSLRALRQDRVLCIPGFLNQLIVKVGQGRLPGRLLKAFRKRRTRQ